MQGFTQEFFLGRGEKYWVPNFCLPHPLLAHYAAHAILFYQLENSTWCARCSRQDKVINLGEEDGMLPEHGKDQL